LLMVTEPPTALRLMPLSGLFVETALSIRTFGVPLARLSAAPPVAVTATLETINEPTDVPEIARPLEALIFIPATTLPVFRVNVLRLAREMKGRTPVKLGTAPPGALMLPSAS